MLVIVVRLFAVFFQVPVLELNTVSDNELALATITGILFTLTLPLALRLIFLSLWILTSPSLRRLNPDLL